MNQEKQKKNCSTVVGNQKKQKKKERFYHKRPLIYNLKLIEFKRERGNNCLQRRRNGTAADAMKEMNWCINVAYNLSNLYKWHMNIKPKDQTNEKIFQWIRFLCIWHFIWISKKNYLKDFQEESPYRDRSHKKKAPKVQNS